MEKEKKKKKKKNLMVHRSTDLLESRKRLKEETVMLMWTLEKVILDLKHDPGSSSYLFSCSQVFVPLFLTVGVYDYFIFGSGTKLIVTASRAQLEGKSSLLCVASDMFPPLVQISWRRREEDGSLKELSSADSEISKLGESNCTASILKIHKREDNLDKYICLVKHEGGRVDSTVQRTGDAVSPTEAPAALTSGPPETELTDLPALPQQYGESGILLWTLPADHLH
ncbi:immunoglobulin lambda-1 light chain-like [Xyrichtys novacula]|nr:immunoglobulin lambda-1 light chain-like [Xyrichtys novacula]